MPLPLAAIGGAIVRGAAGSAMRGAAAGGARAAVGNAVKGKAKSAIKEKAVTISKEKLFAKPKEEDGGGGGLVRQKGGALVKSSSLAIQKVDDKKIDSVGDNGGLLKQLEIIKSNLMQIKGILNSLSDSDKDEYDKRRRALENLKRRSAEEKLEAKSGKVKTRGLNISAPDIPFFERIKRFFLMTLLGTLVQWGMNYLPQIIEGLQFLSTAFTDTWKFLKYAIISLTTNFPRQIKFLAKLTKKIFGGPLKFIGKTILKLGKFAFKTLTKLGSALVNFIKKPVLDIAKKILSGGAKTASTAIVKYTGKEAAKAASKETAKQAAKKTVKSVASNAGKLASRLKAFSKVFKRVPVVGALIGIGIDLALGEPLDRAVVGAIGSSIGAAIGGAIGTGVIPIPVVGTAVGGFVGGAIGDWLAKKLYGDLTGRVSAAEKEAAKSDSVQLQARGGLTRKTEGSLSGGLTRETSVEKRTLSEKTIQRRLNVIRGRKIKNISPKQKNDIFDEDSMKYFSNVMRKFENTLSFTSDILKLAVKLIAGEKIKSYEISSLSQTMTYDFSRSGILDNVENKGQILLSFSNWSRSSLQQSIDKIQSTLTTVTDKEKQDVAKSRQSGGSGRGRRGGRGARRRGVGGGGGGGSGGSVEEPKFSGPAPAGGSADFWTLVAVASREDGDPQSWNDVAQAIYNRSISGVYSKSIRQIITSTWQFEPTWRYPKGAKLGNGKPNKEWFSITDAKTASAASGMSVAAMNSVASALMKDDLHKNSKKFIQGRTDFTGYRKGSKRKGEIQRKSGDNYFGWDWNYKANKVGDRPNFKVTTGGENPNDPRVKKSEKYLADKVKPSSAPTNIVKSSPKISIKVNQIQQQASYESNTPQIMMMPIQSQSSPQNSSKSVPRLPMSMGQSSNLDIEKTLYNFSLY